EPRCSFSDFAVKNGNPCIDVSVKGSVVFIPCCEVAATSALRIPSFQKSVIGLVSAILLALLSPGAGTATEINKTSELGPRARMGVLSPSLFHPRGNSRRKTDVSNALSCAATGAATAMEIIRMKDECSASRWNIASPFCEYRRARSSCTHRRKTCRHRVGLAASCYRSLPLRRTDPCEEDRSPAQARQNERGSMSDLRR